MKIQKNIFFFSILFLLLFSFANAQNKLSEKEFAFRENQNVNIGKQFSNFEKFTPTKNEIEDTNFILDKKLKLENLNREGYYIQYVGIINNNEKLIFLNASCRKTEYFETEILQVKGGGKCYFSGLFNLTKNNFENLYFNAPK